MPVLGEVDFQGPLVLNTSTISLNNTSGPIVIVLILHGSNSSGSFASINLTDASPSNNPCLVYTASPQYDPTRFSLLLIPSQKPSCNTKKKKSNTIFIVALSVVGGVVLESVAFVVIMIAFCKKSSFRRKRPIRTHRRTTDHTEPIYNAINCIIVQPYFYYYNYYFF